MNDFLVWSVLVALIVIQVIEFVAFRSQVGALWRVVEEPRMNVAAIARRWGVDSLDDVRDIMDAHVPCTAFSYIGDDSYSRSAVQAVERRLLMPNAVMFYKETHRGDGVSS